jgi:hypothetical protein
MQALIERFKAEGPASAPFELRSGALVVDPAKFHAALLGDIDQGSGGTRARMGALESDLRDFFAMSASKERTE